VTPEEFRSSIKGEFWVHLYEVSVFLMRLLVAVMFTAADYGVKLSAKFVLDDPMGFSYGILALVSDIAFVGIGALISITGAFRVFRSFVSVDRKRYTRKE